MIEIWNTRKIETLKKDLSTAQNKIVELFTSSVLPVDNQYYTWGQFLSVDKPDNQYGIYGTSSAIQILSLNGFSQENEFISSSCKFLVDCFNDEKSRFNQKEDFSVLYKIAYLIDALKASKSKSSIDLTDNLLANLRNTILDSKGWGYCYNLKSDLKDPLPRITTTAKILLSLVDFKEFRDSEQCQSSLNWLAISIKTKSDISIYELSLSSIVFIEYAKHIVFAESSEIIDECFNRVKEIASRREKNSYLYTESHHFHIHIGNNRFNKYLFFLPDCLLAIALLKRRNKGEHNRYILRIASNYAKIINEQGGFSPLNTSKFSSIDHLWIYRLFEGIKQSNSEELIPSGLSRYLSKPKYFYIVLFVLLLLLAFKVYQSEPLAVLGIVILTIGWNIFSSWFHKQIQRH